ncbi:MAG: hypothetical protein BHV98_07440 [Clostridium sp. CAG:217_53_7]|nr:MAG: hypothetical protein BHV98_07440 [Clostridium sp. CAG:217_53_7]
MFFRLPIVKFFSRLLNRATITVALVLLQAGWLLWAFSYLTTGRIWVNAALRLLSLFIVLYLVRKDEDSSYKIIWIVLIGLLPLLGGALYLVFGNKAPSKGMRRRMQSVEKAHTGDLAQQPGPARQLAGRYPYLKEKPYLLPVAWINRILKYGKETAGGSADNNAAQSIKIGNGRVALLKEYGIIGSGRE